MSRIPDVSPEVPAASWRLLLSLMGRMPARAFSRAFGLAADLPLPRRARASVLGSFVSALGIDISEAELPLVEYPTLNALFVRKLRSGARVWPDDPLAIVSPVDGIIGRCGRVEAGRAVQAKGHSYSIADLLADGREAARFDNGSFLTIYLSPRHYHRIHTPASGSISRATYVPGALYPVNAPAVMHIHGLFARNERLITYLDSARGRIAVVAVGAYNVGRISAAFDPLWSGTGRDAWITNRRIPAPFERRYDPPIDIAPGDELMAFHLGSTVVLLFEAGVHPRPERVPGEEVRVGECLVD